MDDGLASFDLAVASLREIGVRAGDYIPNSIEEWRWFMAGPVPPSDLDTVRKGLPGAGETTPPDETRNPTKGSR